MSERGTPFDAESAQLSELRGMAQHGRYQDLLERLRQMADTELTDRTPLALLAAEAHGRLGGYDEADQWAARALALARARGERYAELRARVVQGAVALERGDLEAADRHTAAALVLARELGDHATQARCLNNLAIMEFYQGDARAALGTFKLALAAYQQAAAPRGIAEAHHNVGIAHRALGDLLAANQAGQEALRLATQAGDETLAALALTGLAETALAGADPDVADSLLAQALRTQVRLQAPDGLAEVWRLQAAVAQARGATDEAVRLLDQAADAATRSGVAYLQAEVQRDLGTTLVASGDLARARAARERAVALFRRVGANHAAAELAELLR